MHATNALLLSLAGAANALIHGVDSSTLVSVATYQKALGEGFVKAIPRGYQEACSSGGQVDPNFAGSYKNAVEAGYKDIDAYIFPCTGSGNSCKDYGTQVKELTDAISADSMNIGTIWFDLETDDECGAWDYGADGNLAEAKKVVDALNASGAKWGVYASPGVWSNIFGSYDVVLDSDAPLWFATYDDVETLDLKQPFGGWTEAVGKQYTDQSASGQFDLNVFA